MSLKYFAAAVFAVAPAVLAGNAIVKNECDFPVYITRSQEGTDGAQVPYSSGEQFEDDIQGSAISIKIMTQKGFCFTDNCIQLEYSKTGGMLWYDLSNINANALEKFLQKGLILNNTDTSAQQISCGTGADAKCSNTYYQPWENENTFSSNEDASLNMVLCSGSGALASAGNAVSSAVSQGASAIKAAVAPSSAATHSSAAASAPATTAAPAAPKVEMTNDGPVVEVTVTHTIGARDAEATAAAEKRHIHAHAHHHRHI